MKKITFLSLILAFAVLTPASLFAQQQKIAVVDMQKIFQDYEKTKVIKLKLDEQANVYKEYAKRLSENIAKLRKEFEVLRDEAQDNMSLSAAERENKRLAAQEKYNQMKYRETELTNYTRTKNAQMQELTEKRRLEVISEIRAVIAQRAKAESISLVFDLSGPSLNDIPMVLYHDTSLDITETVIKELNRGYRADAKDAK